MRSFITKYPLLIFSGLFIILRLPFFLWNFFPRIDGDSFEYFEYAYDIKNGVFPDFSVIPPLYSVFLMLTSFLGLSLKGIVVLQTIISYATQLIFFTQLLKLKLKRVPILGVYVLMIALLFNSFDLQLETAIMTEGLYKPVLLLFTAVLIRMYRAPEKKWNYILLPIVVVLAALTRSNGMYLYFFIGVIGGYILLFKRAKYFSKLVIMVITFVFLNGAWSMVNYISYDTFLFGNTYRIKVILGNIKNNTRLNHNGNLRAFWQDAPADGTVIYPYLKELNVVSEIQVKNIKNKPDLFMNYVYSPVEKDFDFYEDIIPERFDFCFSGKQLVGGPEELGIVKRCFEDPDCRKYSLKEFSNGNKVLNEIGGIEMTIDYILNIIRVLTRNVFTIGLFFCIWFVFGFRILSNLKNTSKESMLISTISSAYVLNILVVTMTHNRFVARYEQVNQFMILLVLFLFFTFYFKGVKNKLLSRFYK